MARTKKGYFATRRFRYEDHDLFQGEVFELRGAANDAVLLGNDYLKAIADAYPSGVELHECVRCGREFVEGDYKFIHDQDCGAQEPRETVVVGPAEAAMIGEATSEV